MIVAANRDTLWLPSGVRVDSVHEASLTGVIEVTDESRNFWRLGTRVEWLTPIPAGGDGIFSGANVEAMQAGGYQSLAGEAISPMLLTIARLPPDIAGALNLGAAQHGAVRYAPRRPA